MAAWNEEVLRRSRDVGYATEGVRTGKVFGASRRLTAVATGVNTDSIFTTGALPVVLFQRSIGRTGAGVSAAIYRAPTYTGGTVNAVQSMSDVSTATSTVTLLAAPTVTATGTQVGPISYSIGNTTGSGQGGISTLDTPIYLRPFVEQNSSCKITSPTVQISKSE